LSNCNYLPINSGPHCKILELRYYPFTYLGKVKNFYGVKLQVELSIGYVNISIPICKQYNILSFQKILVSNCKFKIPQTQVPCSNDYIKKTHNSILFILPVLSEKVQRIPSWVLSHLAERNQGSAAVLI